MLRRLLHQHHEVTRVNLEVVGPTIIEWRAAQARARLDALHIPAWEPYAPFPRPHTDVAKTWVDRG